MLPFHASTGLLPSPVREAAHAVQVGLVHPTAFAGAVGSPVWVEEELEQSMTAKKWLSLSSGATHPLLST